MFKNQLLALCALFTLAVACSKKDKDGADTPPVNVEIKAIQANLSQTTGVRYFANSFKEVTFTDADISSGFTVFAPLDSAITHYDPNARVEEVGPIISANEVKDHIVKGIIKLIDLTHGKKLTTLSGKELVVTIDGDKIMINGVVILSNSSDTAKHIIYTVSNVLCKKPGAAEITVWDGTQWSTTDTLGKPAADADVALYYSRNDFSNNNPAFTGKTNASGKITFSGLPAGTYYLAVKKGDKTNLIEPASFNGAPVAYKPIGIFQPGTSRDVVPALFETRPGDFIFLDANADGKIDANDKVYTPFEVVVASNKTIQATSYIGYVYNHEGASFSDKAQAQLVLDDLYFQIWGWHQQQVIMDGIMSDDADCSGMTNFCELDNFSIYPNSSITTSLWQAGYRFTTSLNRLIMNVPLLNLPASESNNLIAQAKGLRGFVSLQLATYYGALPLQTGIVDANLSMPRSSLTETYQFIKNDLTEAMGILPNKFSGADRFRINGNACKLLLARIAMAQDDFARAKQLSGELIQSSTYSLVAANDIFISDENAEIIWSIKTNFVGAYNPFFDTEIEKFFNPVARYAEVLLINSEARINMNELDATNVNLLLNRRGQQTVTFSTNEQARNTVRSVWKTELTREGQRFAKLVKWGAAMEVLAPKGFVPYRGQWPIPQYVLNKNPNVFQNPGYQ